MVWHTDCKTQSSDARRIRISFRFNSMDRCRGRASYQLVPQEWALCLLLQNAGLWGIYSLGRHESFQVWLALCKYCCHQASLLQQSACCCCQQLPTQQYHPQQAGLPSFPGAALRLQLCGLLFSMLQAPLLLISLISCRQLQISSLSVPGGAGLLAVKGRSVSTC